MPWTATIGPTPETRGVPNDSVDLNVVYSDGTIAFTRSLNVHAGTSVADLESQLRDDVRRLDAFDATKKVIEQLREKVGVVSGGVVSVDPTVDLKDAATLDAAAKEIGKGR